MYHQQSLIIPTYHQQSPITIGSPAVRSSETIKHSHQPSAIRHHTSPFTIQYRPLFITTHDQSSPIITNRVVTIWPFHLGLSGMNMGYPLHPSSIPLKSFCFLRIWKPYGVRCAVDGGGCFFSFVLFFFFLLSFVQFRRLCLSKGKCVQITLIALVT